LFAYQPIDYLHRPQLCVRDTIVAYFVFLLITFGNGSDHIKELSNARPKQPFFFLKPPSSLLIPNNGPVLRPKGVKLHYEVELGLVMGKTVKNLDEKDEKGAIDAIEGKWNKKSEVSEKLLIMGVCRLRSSD
jgi:hypothetical protein